MKMDISATKLIVWSNAVLFWYNKAWFGYLSALTVKTDVRSISTQLFRDRGKNTHEDARASS